MDGVFIHVRPDESFELEYAPHGFIGVADFAAGGFVTGGLAAELQDLFHGVGVVEGEFGARRWRRDGEATFSGRVQFGGEGFDGSAGDGFGHRLQARYSNQTELQLSSVIMHRAGSEPRVGIASAGRFCGWRGGCGILNV